MADRQYQHLLPTYMYMLEICSSNEMILANDTTEGTSRQRKF